VELILSSRFIKFHSLLDDRVVTEFSYRFSSAKLGFIICSFLLRSSPSSASGPSPEQRKAEVDSIIADLAAHDIQAVDLSEDEFAKSHVRHLVGGRGHAEHERIFRFGE
jgi:threonine dehydratase